MSYKGKEKLRSVDLLETANYCTRSNFGFDVQSFWARIFKHILMLEPFVNAYQYIHDGRINLLAIMAGQLQTAVTHEKLADMTSGVESKTT